MDKNQINKKFQFFQKNLDCFEMAAINEFEKIEHVETKINDYLSNKVVPFENENNVKFHRQRNYVYESLLNQK